MNDIKVYNIRPDGWVFHYAHFLCDLVFPEVIEKIYEYDVCYREKSELQTIGHFKPLWEKIMNTKTEELSEEDFKNKDIPMKTITRFLGNENQYEKKEMIQFRDYIFKRFDIKPDPTYPKMILIERGCNKKMVSSEIQDKLKDNKFAFTTGKERREIKDIDVLKQKLNNVTCIMLEHMDIEEQIKHFYNADIIIAAHGAALSNLLFCRENTTMIEIECGKWKYFDVITKELSIHHIKCKNNIPDIIKTFQHVYDLKKNNIKKNDKNIIKNNIKKNFVKNNVKKNFTKNIIKNNVKKNDIKKINTMKLLFW
jgi:hypothetical protein